MSSHQLLMLARLHLVKARWHRQHFEIANDMLQEVPDAETIRTAANEDFSQAYAHRNAAKKMLVELQVRNETGFVRTFSWSTVQPSSLRGEFFRNWPVYTTVFTDDRGELVDTWQ